MRHLVLPLVGALALAGCDSAAGSNDATAPIARVHVAGVAGASDPDGSAPDVFFEVQDVSGRSYYRTAVTNNADVSGGASADIVGGVAVPSRTTPLQIAVYDFNNTLIESTLIAKSARFTADEVAVSAELWLASADAASAARFTLTYGYSSGAAD